MTSNSALGFTQSSALSTQHSVLSTQYSTAPNGEQFPLPTQQDEATEILRLQALVADHRAQGHEIVVVLGVGFVGAVMAGIIADSVRKGAIGGGLGGHDAASCPPNPPLLPEPAPPASSSSACSAHPPVPTGRSRS